MEKRFNAKIVLMHEILRERFLMLRFSGRKKINILTPKKKIKAEKKKFNAKKIKAKKKL